MSDEILSERYRIVRHLARGGMAEVYLAHDELLDRPVAVKVMLAEFSRDESFIERFRREATSAAGLSHPNIVSIYDFGEDGSSYFIVMEYVDGETLGQVIHRDGPLEPTRAVGIAADIAAALAAAHTRGIIHRDVKPDNVLMSGGVAKVADFGIARASSAREGLTMPGSVIGTATYLSPEQAQGLPVDQRSDVYSLGMVLYEMLAGRLPFKGDSVTVAYQQTTQTPPPPSTFNPSVPPELDSVVVKALAKDPAHRQVSADELRDELLGVGRGPAVTPTVVSGLAAASPPSTPRDPTTLMAAPRGGGRPVPPAGAVRSPSREPQAVYRRRRRTVVLGLLLILLLGVIAVVAVLAKGGTTQTATVPKVDGLPVSDAVAAVARAHLKSQVVGLQPGAPDLVASQNPAAGATVNRSTVVTLVVASPATTTTVRPRPNTVPSTRATTTTSPRTTVAPTTTVPPTTTPTTTINPPPTT